MRHYQDICHLSCVIPNLIHRTVLTLQRIDNSLVGCDIILCSLSEDTTLLLILVAVVSGGVIIMALFLIILHCRRLQVRSSKSLHNMNNDKSDHEIWPESIEKEEKVIIALDECCLTFSVVVMQD